jgi:hypothetical protein
MNNNQRVALNATGLANTVACRKILGLKNTNTMDAIIFVLFILVLLTVMFFVHL